MSTKPATKTNGWTITSAAGFQGQRLHVIQLIQTAPNVPEEWRALIAARIANNFSDQSGIKVDIHCTIINGVETFSGTISPMKLADAPPS